MTVVAVVAAVVADFTTWPIVVTFVVITFVVDVVVAAVRIVVVDVDVAVGAVVEWKQQ